MTETDEYAHGSVEKLDSEPINLDFTQDELPELKEGRPYISEARRWIISWENGAAPYEFTRSGDVLFNGTPTACVKSTDTPTEGYLFQHFAAAQFRSKRVRFSSHVKTKSAEKGAWLRASAYDTLGNDLVWKYSERSVRGTTDWTKLEVEFDVPQDAYVIAIGADLSGGGEMYLGGLKFDVIGEAHNHHRELLPGISLYKAVDDGWLLERAEHEVSIPDRPGRGIKLLPVAPGPQMKSSVAVRLSSFPLNRELTFSCLLRGTRCGQKVKVYVYAYDSNWKSRLQSCSHISTDHKDWTSFETTFVAPSASERLHIWIVSFAAQPAYITQPSLKVGLESYHSRQYNTNFTTPSEPKATKVAEAHYKAAARAIRNGEEGTVTFPIPGPYRGQVPISFTLETKPRAALLGYEIKKREDGLNWIAEVRVKPPEKGVIISWKSKVLIRGESEDNESAVTSTEQAHVAQWLRSTKCVQSDDPQISEKAHELSKKSKNIEEYVRNVIEFTSKNRGKKGKRFDSLDAKTAIDAGGSCTSRANLAAALLRANRIPARTVSHLPTWMRSYFFEHWLVEYWHPERGWTWLEPTLAKVQPAANEIIVLAVSSPDDEDKCNDPLHLRYLMPGGAYLSGCELSEELMMAPIIKKVTGPNIATELAEIRGTNSEIETLFETALQNFHFTALQKHYSDQSKVETDEVTAAIYEGNATELSNFLRGMRASRLT